MMTQQALQLYMARGRKAVDGWLTRVDAEIARALLAAQNAQSLGGAVAEVGVHHGKFFIGLCLGRTPGQGAYCIDIFEDQHLNEDASGRGDRAMLERNLERHGIDAASVVIDKISSLEIAAPTITGRVGEVRFFSIDGGHWRSIVRNDLALAEACLAPHGVIALDDFQRPEWPDVSAGYFDWHGGRQRPIVPLAIGLNKLFLCDTAFQARYREALLQDEFLRPRLNRMVSFQDHEVPVFAHSIPEHGVRNHMRLAHPRFFAWMKSLRPMARA